MAEIHGACIAGLLRIESTLKAMLGQLDEIGNFSDAVREAKLRELEDIGRSALFYIRSAIGTSSVHYLRMTVALKALWGRYPGAKDALPTRSILEIIVCARSHVELLAGFERTRSCQKSANS